MPTTPETDPLEFSRRLRQVLLDAGEREYGLGAMLARKYKVSQPTAHAWLNGGHLPEAARVQQIADDYKTPFEYLMFGRQARSNAGSAPNAVEEFFPLSELVGVTRVRGASLAAGSGEILWDVDEVQNSHAFRRDYLQSRHINPDRCKVWTVRGDSMEPRYSDGDIVLIDMGDRTPVHGKVFALVGDDGLRIKQLRRGASGWEMHSFNPDQNKYSPEPIVSQNYAIIGRVKWRGGDED